MKTRLTVLLVALALLLPQGSGAQWARNAKSWMPQDVIWQFAVGVTVSGNSLTKTAADGWDAGASSVQSLASGDGYAEVTADDLGNLIMFGLSNGDTDQHMVDIDFALHQNGTGLTVYENGVWKTNGPANVAGDTLRVAVVGGAVEYSKNGVVFYTSLIAPTYPLLVDNAIFSNGGQILDAKIAGALP